MMISPNGLVGLGGDLQLRPGEIHNKETSSVQFLTGAAKNSFCCSALRSVDTGRGFSTSEHVMRRVQFLEFFERFLGGGGV